MTSSSVFDCRLRPSLALIFLFTLLLLLTDPPPVDTVEMEVLRLVVLLLLELVESIRCNMPGCVCSSITC